MREDVCGTAHSATQSTKIEGPHRLPHSQWRHSLLGSVLHPFACTTMQNTRSMGVFSSEMCRVWCTVVPDRGFQPTYRRGTRIPLCSSSLEIEDQPKATPYHHNFVRYPNIVSLTHGSKRQIPDMDTVYVLQRLCNWLCWHLHYALSTRLVSQADEHCRLL